MFSHLGEWCFAVLEQIVVSLGSGPWDQLFGGGNSPAIAVAALSAFVSGLIAILAIPRSRSDKSRGRHWGNLLYEDFPFSLLFWQSDIRTSIKKCCKWLLFYWFCSANSLCIFHYWLLMLQWKNLIYQLSFSPCCRERFELSIEKQWQHCCFLWWKMTV